MSCFLYTFHSILVQDQTKAGYVPSMRNFILFILLFCHTESIIIKKIIKRLINIKFKISTQLGRSDCGGEISGKLTSL